MLKGNSYNEIFESFSVEDDCFALGAILGQIDDGKIGITASLLDALH